MSENITSRIKLAWHDIAEYYHVSERYIITFMLEIWGVSLMTWAILKYEIILVKDFLGIVRESG